jgi:Ca-activated chloride channel family protein
LPRVCCSANEPAAPVKFMLPPTKRRAVALPIALVTTLLARAAAFPQTTAQQSPPEGNAAAHISVDVSLVVLHATVTGQKGHVVSDLSEQDFQVYEDGIPQQIKLFSHDDVPVSAGLAVDHSGSMKRKLAEVSAAARTFVQAGNPGDEIFVVNFNEHVELGLPPSTRFSNDPIQLARAISQSPASGRTVLYDSIFKALELLKEGGPDKKVLLVISDGGDNASTQTLAQALRLAEQSSAIIYSVGIFDPDDDDRNPRVLRKLAGSTGGLAFFPSELNQVSAVCARIARDIRSQYTIAYSPARPAKPGEYRTIRVTARDPRHGKLTVRTRTGYRVGGGAGGLQ